jgi:hypothetical protein
MPEVQKVEIVAANDQPGEIFDGVRSRRSLGVRTVHVSGDAPYATRRVFLWLVILPVVLAALVLLILALRPVLGA